jgi:hypothetical protein
MQKARKKKSSPFNVKGVDLELTVREIVGFIHEGRRVDVDLRAKKTNADKKK